MHRLAISICTILIACGATEAKNLGTRSTYTPGTQLEEGFRDWDELMCTIAKSRYPSAKSFQVNTSNEGALSFACPSYQ